MSRRATILLFVPILLFAPRGLASQALLEMLADEKIGDFFHMQVLDELDDSDRSFVVVFEEDLGSPSLRWQCGGDSMLLVLLNIERRYGGNSQNEIFVRYRFDKSPASDQESWPLLQDDESTMVPQDQIVTFTERALAAETILVEASDPLDGETHRFRFGLNGLREALAKLPCEPPAASD